MEHSFPIIKHPTANRRVPILVSIPHYGTHSLPQVTYADYSEPWFTTFAYGFADTFVGELYADLHEHGATILATPLSRIFVDVNRRRNDFEHHHGAVRSQRGVVRTHTIRDVPIFKQPLELTELEARLQAFYDPYYTTLGHLLGQLRTTYGYALLLDGHTGSPRRMKEYQIIIGTKHGTTSDTTLAATVAAIFTRHGFEVHHNISGYAGGNIITTYGQPQTQQIHALQLEINASLLMMTSRQEFIEQVSRGEIPPKAEDNIACLRQCLQKVIVALSGVLAELHPGRQEERG
jgi:N-formylglutamate deformylase